METTSNLTPDDIISEVESLTDVQRWFKPVNPLTEPVEELEFVVDGFCAKGMITIIGASPGAGKSILIQYLFSKHRNGLLAVTPGSKAIYLTGADSSETEIRRRSRSIKHNDGLYTVELPEDQYCTTTNETFMEYLKTQIIEGGFNAVVFDTVSDFHDGSTYEAELVNKSMSIFRRFAKETNVAMILITHTKKGSKIKAEYNVEDIADSRIFTSKSDFVFGVKSEYQDDSSNLIELQNLKSRSPRPLKKIRALVSYSTKTGLTIEQTERQFQAELESTNRDQRKNARITQAQKLKSEGKTVREIATSMGVAVGTASNYLKADINLVQGIHYNPDEYIND
jgi:RecA-family ATPase